MEGAATNSQYRIPIAFDITNIVSTSGLSGTTIVLVNSLGAVPNDYHGVVDGIFPYLEGSAGPITGPRIPGTGITITWQVLLGGAPASYYGAINTILCPWNGQNDRTLIEVPSGLVLSAQVLYTDSNAIYSYIGLRLKGMWIPKEQMEHMAVSQQPQPIQAPPVYYAPIGIAPPPGPINEMVDNPYIGQTPSYESMIGRYFR